MPTPEKPKILVVNDAAASLLALTSLLSQWTEEIGYEIVTAQSGEEALRHVLRHDFAVILLDVNMPGMDGFETAEAIHLRPRSAAIPIIFVTAYLADEMNRLKGYQKGAVDYLFTPIIPQILRAKVSVFVALSKTNLELRHQAKMLNERTNELTEANKRLKVEIEERIIAVQQNKAKDEFLAMLGHELRNPLSAITSAASILGFKGLNPDSAARAVAIIQRQSQHLSHIVDDLLDLSRMMSGKVLLSKQPIELGALLSNCVDTLKATGRTERYTLTVQTESAWIDADPTRIEQIITNLLDNAIKYTPLDGTIDVALSSNADGVELRIQDSGIGIPSDLLPHVFDVFVQGARSLDRAEGGLGIGLALVRQLVELHGGTISAESDGAGRGSTFVLRFPKALSEKPEAKQPAVVSSDSFNLLIIEDNEDGREMIAMMLSSYGHQVFKAANGMEGLEIAARDKPDVALIDIGLPGIDGYEVARRLRADPATSKIKLIALTGYGLEQDQQQALDAGFDLHLVKPVTPQLLLEAIGLQSTASTKT